MGVWADRLPLSGRGEAPVCRLGSTAVCLRAAHTPIVFRARLAALRYAFATPSQILRKRTGARFALPRLPHLTTARWDPFYQCMRELAATGWMSNRGRQNAASFLAKELGIDWRLGARRAPRAARRSHGWGR